MKEKKKKNLKKQIWTKEYRLCTERKNKKGFFNKRKK